MKMPPDTKFYGDSEMSVQTNFVLAQWHSLFIKFNTKKNGLMQRIYYTCNNAY